MALQIDAKGGLIVRAPYQVKERAILEFIERNQDWIDKAKKVSKDRARERKEYQPVIGGRFLFLGKEYIISETNERKIQCLEDRIRIPQNSEADKELSQWLKKQARSFLKARVKDHAARMGFGPEEIRITQARSRWGSCSGRNVISFSYRLMMCPEEVIDYVIIHELCHIPEKNHKNSFWQLVEAFDPDYKKHREWLHSHGFLMEVI